jgi:copper(I)-binding protein
MLKSFIFSLVLSLAIDASAQSVKAPVVVDGAWIRATVAGQKGTGGFMKLIASEDLRLVGVSSPAALVGEVHEMKMAANNVMEMRALPALDLPKAKTIELKPGGYHLMLMELKQVLNPGTNVPVTLFFTDAKGQASQLVLTVPISQSAPGGSSNRTDDNMSSHSHGKHKH